MALNYQQTGNQYKMPPILDEYTEWFMQVLRRISYPEFSGEKNVFSKPVIFQEWLEDVQAEHAEIPYQIMRLQQVYEDLGHKANEAINEVLKTKKTLEFDVYDRLVTLFEEFVHGIRVVERGTQQESSSLDTLTGLRTQAAMSHDMNLELERLARQGKPFVVCLVRLDNLDKVVESHGVKARDQALLFMAKQIKRCMRSFDDAYRMKDDSFILSLKQTNGIGGRAALDRLKAFFDGSLHELVFDGKPANISFSACMTEPFDGQVTKDILEGLQRDLDRFASESGVVLKHEEQSPLQRYISEIGE